MLYEGQNPIGYCWTKPEPAENRGRIYMLGADPDHRGKGFGRRALLAGLDHLKSKGTETVVLTVDSQNASACGLYRSLGFEIRTSSLWYEKLLR